MTKELNGAKYTNSQSSSVPSTPPLHTHKHTYTTASSVHVTTHNLQSPELNDFKMKSDHSETKEESTGARPHLIGSQ